MTSNNTGPEVTEHPVIPLEGNEPQDYGVALNIFDLMAHFTIGQKMCLGRVMGGEIYLCKTSDRLLGVLYRPSRGLTTLLTELKQVEYEVRGGGSSE